jgi:hypothetical protein
LRVPCQLGLLPGVDVQTAASYLLAQEVDLVLEVLKLKAGLLVSAGARFQLRHLLLNDFQLPLRFYGWIHD